MCLKVILFFVGVEMETEEPNVVSAFIHLYLSLVIEERVKQQIPR